MVLQLLYLVNGRHVPDPKWRRFRVTGLEWLPDSFAALRDRAEGGPRDEAGYALRAEATLELVGAIVDRLEQCRELERDWCSDYLDICPDYNPKK